MITMTAIIPAPDKSGEAFLKQLNAEADEWALRAKAKMQEYPPYKYVSWKSIGGFVSARQEFFVRKSLADGTMDVPYTRTQSLRNSWFTQKKNTASAIVREVLTRHPKARYVQDRSTQHVRMAVQGWFTTQDYLEQVWPKEAMAIIDRMSRVK